MDSYLRKILNVIPIFRFIELLTSEPGSNRPVSKDNIVNVMAEKSAGRKALLIPVDNSVPPFHHPFISEAKFSLANTQLNFKSINENTLTGFPVSEMKTASEGMLYPEIHRINFISDYHHISKPYKRGTEYVQ